MSFRKLRVTLLRLAFIPVVFLAVFVRPNWGLESDVAFGVELVGYAFLLAGVSVRIWSILYVGGRKSQELITDGPYSLCRHPLYVGSFLLTIGAGLCFENIPMLAAGLLIVLPVHVIVARMEERHLTEKFPQEYPPYAQQVPRFWPRLRNYRSRESIFVPIWAIRRIAIDVLGVMLIPEVEDMLEVLHQHGLLPTVWHFP